MQCSPALFAPVFAIVYGALYAAKLPIFIYYPLHGELALERLPPNDGPGMLWYGWLAAGSVAGLTAVTLVPARWAARVPASAGLISALAGMVLILIGQLHWFVA